VKITFVFIALGIIYFVSWVIQLASGGKESAAERRARLQERSEAIRRSMQQRQQQQLQQPPRPRPQPGQPRESSQVQMLRNLERSLGLPEGSVAPRAPRPPQRAAAPPPAPRPRAPEPEDHGGDLRQRHLQAGHRELAHLAKSKVGSTNLGNLRQRHLDSSFREETAMRLPAHQPKLGITERMPHLTPLQEAIVLSEILQPPVSRRRRR